MKFLVSYQYFGAGPNCGNKSFDTREDLDAYVHANEKTWTSFSLWTFEPAPNGLSDLTPLLD